MKYFKSIANGYITSISTFCGGIEINESEHNSLLDIIRNKPAAPEGYDYRLKEGLTWEIYELPPTPEEDSEATAEDYENALGRFGV